jgi:glycosyltransferase involved in cell wall biosynthesis
MLSYLENKMPIIAATDITTDIGEIIEYNNAGISLISGDIVAMQSALNKYVNDRELVISHGENAHQLLMKNYLVNTTYNLINNKFINV